MQMLNLPVNMTLADLSDIVGSRNVESVLAANSLSRSPDIGRQNRHKQSAISATASVTTQRKMTLLNGLVGDSDIFESAALQDENGWKVLNVSGALPGTLRMPETVKLPDSVSVLGNGKHVDSQVYGKAMLQLKETGKVSSSVFASYSTLSGNPRTPLTVPSAATSNIFEMFHIPWGKVTLYSSLAQSSINFPVYPEELEDARTAKFTTMPDLLYQYEPWQLYQSSGPRSNTYTFHFHRDMWTGDHRDGKANELIRFCEANCYPEFNGSAVNVSTVSLYISGKKLITGVLTDTKTQWGGPLGLDDWYLECKLEITITEVSDEPLNFASVRSKGLIG